MNEEMAALTASGFSAKMHKVIVRIQICLPTLGDITIMWAVSSIHIHSNRGRKESLSK